MSILHDLDTYEFLEEEEDIPYLYEDIEDTAQVETLPFQDILKYCVQPTVLDIYKNLTKLFTVCLCFRVLIQVLRPSENLTHLLSAILGLLMIYVYFDLRGVHLIGTACISYFWLIVVLKVFKRRSGFLVSVPILAYMVICELFFVKHEVWQKIRGTQMVLGMKVISLAFDINSKAVEEPSIPQFLGYIFNVGTVIFGPWVSYNDYRGLTKRISWSFDWVKSVVSSFLLSLVFFTLSVCLLEWIIPDTSGFFSLIYRDALVYRVGHYFISFVSTTSAVLSGFDNSLTVTKPLLIEKPYSLVEVVINWNIPMHTWLKSYVFKTCLKRGGSFFAIMSTYIVSSLLHGMNVRLAAVLLSLGVYTYVEHTLRQKLADRFDACIAARPCLQHCRNHRYPTSNLIVYQVNLLFKGLAIAHLAYLGILIDISNSDPVPFTEAFGEWENVSFVSHWIILATYIVSLCI